MKGTRPTAVRAPVLAEQGQPEPASRPASAPVLDRRHLRFGWWALLVFLTLGLALETLHGFKVEAYLRVSNETRRLMWTLAHAHGTMLALLNIAFALSLKSFPAWAEGRKKFASTSLLAATVLMPAGFFFGGAFIYGGDPGLAIVLVPAGGILLFAAVLLTALAATGGRENR